MKNTIRIAVVFSLMLSSFAGGQEVQTVHKVDLERYAGLWYEIAKIPNSFQKKCVAGTTAEYTPLEDGNIRVVNRCREADGDEDSVTGIARVIDTESNAKLQVSFVRFFGRNWFWGDYWIIGLDSDYQWAIVGHPNRSYGWILARSPEMHQDVLEECRRILREHGYDPDEFVETVH